MHAGITEEDNPSLFTSFWHAAHWTWERRETAKQAGFPFSEETITETILLDLATAHRAEIQIYPLNKYQEGQMSTPEQKCISWPEQKYISDAGNKAPELGAFS